MDKKDDNNDQIKKMMQVGLKLLELLSSLSKECKDCEKCKEFKNVAEKATTLFAKIIAMQAEDILILESMLNQALDAIEKMHEIQNQNDPDILH